MDQDPSIKIYHDHVIDIIEHREALSKHDNGARVKLITRINNDLASRRICYEQGMDLYRKLLERWNEKGE